MVLALSLPVVIIVVCDGSSHQAGKNQHAGNERNDD
jgi:hypothetical protein